MSEKILDNTTLAAEQNARESVKYHDWQPIETARRDGTVVDLWVKDRGRVTDCHWHKDGEWVEDAHDNDDPGWVPIGNPTHWQPIPLPPTPAGEAPATPAKAEDAETTRFRDALERIALLDEADGHELTWEHASRMVAIATSALGKHPSEINWRRHYPPPAHK